MIAIGTRVTLAKDATVGDFARQQCTGKVGTVIAEEPPESHFCWVVFYEEDTGRLGNVFAFDERDLVKVAPNSLRSHPKETPMTHPQQQPFSPQSPPQPPKRHRVWLWVLFAIVLIPVLVVVGCSALFAGGVAAVQSQRQGGTVAIGKTFTYGDKITVSVSDVHPYTPDNPYELKAGETAYAGTATVKNGTPNPINTVTVTVNVTVDGSPAQRIYDSVPASQDLAAGQSGKVPFQFEVKKGTAAALQVSVAAAFNEPVFFTGKL